MATLSVIGSIIASLFGGHAINIAGPMTAICSSEKSEPKEGRYVAAVVLGVIFMTFGIFASDVVQFVVSIQLSIVSPLQVLQWLE